MFKKRSKSADFIKLSWFSSVTTCSSSSSRKRGSIIPSDWIPAFAGMTSHLWQMEEHYHFSKRILTLSITILMLTQLSACGIKKDLIRPSDIPAYEKEQEKKRGSLPF